MYTPRLKTKYSDEIVLRLQEKYSYKSVMQVPKLEKDLFKPRFRRCCY